MLAICQRVIVALFMVLGSSLMIYALVPQAVKYQSVLCSGNEQAFMNGSVQFGISIKQGFSGPIASKIADTGGNIGFYSFASILPTGLTATIAAYNAICLPLMQIYPYTVLNLSSQ